MGKNVLMNGEAIDVSLEATLAIEQFLTARRC
jgi:hypothetical protein